MTSLVSTVKRALGKGRSNTDEIAEFQRLIDSWNPNTPWTIRAEVDDEKLARSAASASYDPEFKHAAASEVNKARSVIMDFSLHIRNTVHYPKSDGSGHNFELTGRFKDLYSEDAKLGSRFPLGPKTWFSLWVLQLFKKKATTGDAGSGITLYTANPAAASASAEMLSPTSADSRKSSEERAEEARARADPIVLTWEATTSESEPRAGSSPVERSPDVVNVHAEPGSAKIAISPPVTTSKSPESAPVAPSKDSKHVVRVTPASSKSPVAGKAFKAAAVTPATGVKRSVPASSTSVSGAASAIPKAEADTGENLEEKYESAESQDFMDAQWQAVAKEMSKLGVDNEEMVNLMTTNLNGMTIASDGEAAAGYVTYDDKFHIFREHSHDIPLFDPLNQDMAPLPGTEEHGSKFPASFMMNWILNCYMKAKKDAKAITGVILVQQYIKLLTMYSGVYAPSKRLRKVYSDEYEYHNVKHVPLNDAIVKVLALKKDAKVEANIKSAGSNILRIIGTVVHMFRTRNHHYQDSAIEFLDRTYNAAWNGTGDMFGMSHLQLFRESIHCAGMYPLVMLIERARTRNLLPAALVIRLSAARAGTAPVRVTAAAFRTMKAEPFYKIVEKYYKPAIDALFDQDDQLAAIGDYSHINHYFFAGSDIRGDYDENVILPVVALAVGYIKSLDRNASLQKQQTLVKRVANYTAIVNAYKEAFEKFRDDKIKTGDLESILSVFKVSS